MMNPLMNPVQGIVTMTNLVVMTNVNMTTIMNTSNNLPASNNQTATNGNETTVEVVVPLVHFTLSAEVEEPVVEASVVEAAVGDKGCGGGNAVDQPMEQPTGGSPSNMPMGCTGSRKMVLQ